MTFVYSVCTFTVLLKAVFTRGCDVCVYYNAYQRKVTFAYSVCTFTVLLKAVFTRGGDVCWRWPLHVHVYRTRWQCYVMPLSTVPFARPRCLTNSSLKGMDSSVLTQTPPLIEWEPRWLLLMILKILLDDITRETPCCLRVSQWSVYCILQCVENSCTELSI